jgi:hypothetical protein
MKDERQTVVEPDGQLSGALEAMQRRTFAERCDYPDDVRDAAQRFIVRCFDDISTVRTGENFDWLAVTALQMAMTVVQRAAYVQPDVGICSIEIERLKLRAEQEKEAKKMESAVSSTDGLPS